MPIDHRPVAARSSVLLEAAFGDEPGRVDLPVAYSGIDAWHRAVTLGGQGHYSRSKVELTRTGHLGRQDASLRSLALSTEASLLRQLGWHRLGAHLDGAAFALASSLGSGEQLVVEARCDALTGLAADALGLGRLALGQQLLHRCAADLVDADARFWRQGLRLQWVSAEIALVAGAADRALEFAQAGDALATDCPSMRHRIKSRLLLAAAQCLRGDLGVAGETARQVVQACGDHGLLPLRWAAAMLLNGIDSESGAGLLAGECARGIEHRGGHFRKT